MGDCTVIVVGGVGVFVAAVGAVEGEAAGGFAVDEDADVDGEGDGLRQGAAHDGGITG